MGNLGSIKNMFKKIGVESEITSNLEKIKKATKLVLPGVGSFDNGMKNIKQLNLLPTLNYLALEKKIPILGICLGMQLMTNGSEEGKLAGLSWINANTKKFIFNNNKMKVPHMGWNNVKIINKNNITKNLNNNSRFYFVHSYFVECNNKNDILMTTNYNFNFVSAFKKNNILGVQFHPEKSHKFGMVFLKSFSNFK